MVMRSCDAILRCERCDGGILLAPSTSRELCDAAASVTCNRSVDKDIMMAAMIEIGVKTPYELIVSER